ncbi:hypothetical protein LX36DRAFT_131414 [Colletotrichum falcatum]|nr:hypothetical protein LX36DRAFT_131414 [Colletotrichum falcatum]
MGKRVRTTTEEYYQKKSNKKWQQTTGVITVSEQDARRVITMTMLLVSFKLDLAETCRPKYRYCTSSQGSLISDPNTAASPSRPSALAVTPVCQPSTDAAENAMHFCHRGTFPQPRLCRDTRAGRRPVTVWETTEKLDPSLGDPVRRNLAKTR